jgi:hypothetical protein
VTQRKLTDRQIAELRAWWAERSVALRRLGTIKLKAAELGVSHALIERVTQDPTYRPTPPELAERVARERPPPADFDVIPRPRS